MAVGTLVPVLTMVGVVAAGCGGTVDVFGGEGGASGEGGDAVIPLPSGGGGAGATSSASGTSATTGSGGAPTGVGSSSSSASGVTVGASSSASSGPGSSSASSGGGPLCDGTGVCDSCASCAWNGPCQGYAQACTANPECVAIIQCYQQCNAEDCTTPCWIPHPGGHADYLAASICVTCDNCYADCNGDQVGCPEN